MLNFDWLSGISQETAKMVFFSLYVFIGLMVLIIPNEYIFQGVAKEERFWYKNLKLWALAVLGVLATIYYLF